MAPRPPSPRDFTGAYVFAAKDEAGYAQHFRGTMAETWGSSQRNIG